MITTKVYANMSAMQYGKRMDAERLRRVAEARTLDEAFKMLGDYGFYCADGLSVDGFIVGETDRLIAFIDDVAASEKLKNALTARFVYNNAKLAYKSRFAEMPSDGYYSVGLDADKIAAGDYSETDKYMCAALTALDEADERRPQAIDLCLTRAMYDYVCSCGIGLVKKYFKAEIDMKNILSAARMRRLGIESGDEFIAGGSVPRETLDESIAAEGFADCFENTRFFEYAENIERNEFKELWRAERDADDYLYYLTAGTVAAFTSYQPFLNYYTETLAELKTVKTALVCIKTDTRGSFYERIPQLYK